MHPVSSSDVASVSRTTQVSRVSLGRQVLHEPACLTGTGSCSGHLGEHDGDAMVHVESLVVTVAGGHCTPEYPEVVCPVLLSGPARQG